MPENLASHIKDHTRWTTPNIQTAFHLNFLLLGTKSRRCTLWQRLAGFVFGGSSFVIATLVIFGFLGLPLALLSGYPSVVYSTAWQLKWLIRTISIWVFSDWLHKGAMALFVGYRDAMKWDQADQWLVPYFTIAFVRGFLLPKCLGGRKPGSIPSKTRTNFDERDPHHRPTLLTRIKTLFFAQKLYIHFLFIYLCLLGLCFNLLRTFFPNLAISSAYGYIALSGKEKWIFLLSRIEWPLLFWLQSIASCWVPLAYCICTPVEIRKEDVLEWDEKSGVRRVREACWGPEMGLWGRRSDHLSCFLVIYTAVCFWGSWYVDD